MGGFPIRYTLDGRSTRRISKIYEGPLNLTESCTLRAVAFRKGVEPREFTCRFDSHKAVGNDVKYLQAPHCRYRAGLPACLTDGLRGKESFRFFGIRQCILEGYRTR